MVRSRAGAVRSARSPHRPGCRAPTDRIGSCASFALLLRQHPMPAETAPPAAAVGTRRESERCREFSGMLSSVPPQRPHCAVEPGAQRLVKPEKARPRSLPSIRRDSPRHHEGGSGRKGPTRGGGPDLGDHAAYAQGKPNFPRLRDAIRRALEISGVVALALSGRFPISR
jgi:hypothetical protein